MDGLILVRIIYIQTKLIRLYDEHPEHGAIINRKN